MSNPECNRGNMIRTAEEFLADKGFTLDQNGSVVKRPESKRKNPVYAKCVLCQYTTFIEVEPEFTSMFTCPKCKTEFQIQGTWKPKEIMFLEIKNEVAVPYLCAPKPTPNTPAYFAIWNFIAKVWPDVKNFIEYGHFRYYAISQFEIIVTNDPEILSFGTNIDKATTALISKLRSFETNVISPEPSDIDNFVAEFEFDMQNLHSSKSKAVIKPSSHSVISDLDPTSPDDPSESI